MLETILVPLDGSAHAEAALALAALIPSRRLRLLTVRPDLVQLDEICASAEEGEAYLERIAAPLREQGRSVETRVIFGDARRQIAALAALADLVIMGSRGCGATKTLVVGSVAEWVARHAPAPTLIVRGGADGAATLPLTRIVVPMDGAPLAEQALPMACRMAAELGLPIHLVRVVDFDFVRASVEAGIAAAQASAAQHAAVSTAATEYLDAQAQRLRNDGCLVTQHVRTGSPVAELLDEIVAGDLVVLATRERGGVARWAWGSVADELVRRAAGPVLLVRATRAQDDAP